MNGESFRTQVDHAFGFLGDLGFRDRAIQVSGRHYLAEFEGHGITVGVSFEPGDNVLTVYVATDGADLDAVDDPSRTPRLADLTRRFMPMVTRQKQLDADARFRSLRVGDTHEERLVRAARDLYLVLPKFLDARQVARPAANETS